MNESAIFKNITDGRFKSDIDWMLYVLREVHELMWILKGLKAHIPEGADDKLRMIVSGSDFAALDTNTQSRNTQFELRIASYFCQAGCKVDMSTDTDVLAMTDEYAFYVECKRASSADQFQRRLMEAKKQLVQRMPSMLGKRKAYGFIAVDVTKVAYAHNGLTWGLTNEHARDVIQDKMNSVVKLTKDIPLFTDCCDLLQYWLQIHIPSFIMRPPTTTTRFSSFGIINSRLDFKAIKALRVFMTFSAIGNRPDGRDAPGEILIPRTTLELPAGTMFKLDDHLFSEFMKCGKVSGRASDERIAELTFDEVKHEFTFLEFEMLIANISESERKRLAANADYARLELIIKMYIQRYPYKNRGIDSTKTTDQDHMNQENV